MMFQGPFVYSPLTRGKSRQGRSPELHRLEGSLSWNANPERLIFGQAVEGTRYELEITTATLTCVMEALAACGPSCSTALKGAGTDREAPSPPFVMRSRIPLPEVPCHPVTGEPYVARKGLSVHTIKWTKRRRKHPIKQYSVAFSVHITECANRFCVQFWDMEGKALRLMLNDLSLELIADAVRLAQAPGVDALEDAIDAVRNKADTYKARLEACRKADIRG